eukprot:TRINITY_DN4316_c0_g1_i5.p1 TRINITY_DN4316_c0_g1~~TRINITY_DN4316_c0_g1_i5.p1  ORF type:complete len:747 (-),score=186.41 TRINITY_DN4316_c0_g1_i5:132-2372(-)
MPLEMNSGRRLRVSFILDDRIDSQSEDSSSQTPGHCFGINALKFVKSPNTVGKTDFSHAGNLYSGGRDASVCQWIISEAEDRSTSVRAGVRFEHHTDWVNDLLVTRENNLITCSSDTTIKMWNVSDGVSSCMATLRKHTDYVKCLAYSSYSPSLLATAGLDSNVYVWDIERLKVITQFKSNGREDTEENRSDQNQNQNQNQSDQNHTNQNHQQQLKSVPFEENSLEKSILQPNRSPYYSLIGMFSTNPNYVTTENVGSVPAGAGTFGRSHQKGSIYSMAISEEGNVLVTGSSDRLIRLWDPRSSSASVTQYMKLQGHSENVKSLLLSPDGKICISGSADRTIRVWDVRQLRTLQILEIHEDSVWALSADTNFRYLFSGGRDKNVHRTNLSDFKSDLLTTLQEPILTLASDTEESVWIGTGSARLLHKKFGEDRKESEQEIKGRPGIAASLVLNDKRHVLTKDTENQVALWDVMLGKKIKNLGSEISIEDRAKEMLEIVSVSNWFTLDTTTGSLTVHLEYPQCYSAEVYATDMGITGTDLKEDTRVNLGDTVIRSLFSTWLKRRRGESDTSSEKEKENYPQPVIKLTVERDLPVIISESGTGTLIHRCLRSEWNGREPLEWVIPPWIAESLLNNTLPQQKDTIGFFLISDNEKKLPQLPHGSGKLNAPRYIRIKRVATYVFNKLELPLKSKEKEKEKEIKPEEYLEILCNQKVLSPTTNLGTVRAFFWNKGGEEFVLHYRLKGKSGE